MDNKPNFLVIGAARSGTTSLFKYLDAHPDIFMSEIKEINFFSNPNVWSKGMEWYECHFDSAKAKLVGEASTSYTSAPVLPDVPERIYSHLGPIKLIYVLRDPIDRLVSHYLHRVSRGAEFRSFSDVIKNTGDALLWQGRYSYQIDQFLKVFPVENLLLITLDELKASPEETARRIYSFLDVNDMSSSVDVYARHNVNTRITKKSFFGRAVMRYYHRYIEPRNLPYRIKVLFLRLAEVGASDFKAPELTAEEYIFLKDLYSEDVERLSNEFAIDTSSWRDYGVTR